MNEYVITFKRLQTNCKHKTGGVYQHILKNSHACRLKMTMEWVESEDPAKFIECKEDNCPVLEKCDRLVP